MKTNFFIFFFLLVGCTPNTTVSTNAITKTSCPIVLFSSEHSQYISGNTKPITTENIRYRAEINNYAFNSECSIKDNIFQTELSLLFVVKPDLTEKSSITKKLRTRSILVLAKLIIFIEAVNNMKKEKALSPFLQKMKDAYLSRNQNGKYKILN